MESKYFVPYETAKLLKEKGYDEKISFAYNKDKELIRRVGSLDMNNTDWNKLHDIERIYSGYMYLPRISAPTYHETLYWLEKKGIMIGTEYDFNTKSWKASIVTKTNCMSLENMPYREYALNEAIVYVLELM